MDDFRELYRRIEYLRNNGIKMKEIADCAGMAPSIPVFSVHNSAPGLFRGTEKLLARGSIGPCDRIGQQHIQTTPAVRPAGIVGTFGQNGTEHAIRPEIPRTFARRNTAFHHTGGQHMRTLHELQPFFFLGLPEDGTFYHQSIRKQGVHPHRTVKCLRGGAMGHGSHR